jgi:hypothetical protein
MKNKNSVSPIALAAAAAMAVAATMPAPAATTIGHPVTPVADPTAVAAVVSAIDAAVAALPADATAQDVQAKVTFALDQSGALPAVIIAALDQAVVKYPKGKINTALQDIRSTRYRQAGIGGTGSLAGGGGITMAAGPTVGGGGGGTDYTAPR